MQEVETELVLEEGPVQVHRVPIDYSGYFAVQEPAARQKNPPAILIALHGYGQSCRRFIRNFAALRERDFLVVAPQAINQFYWERGKVGFAWITRFMRDRTLDHTVAYFDRVMGAVEHQFAFDPERVFLMGFSNGAAMAFRLGTRGGMAPAGIISCCGDLPLDVEERLPQLGRFPVLIVHGKDDPMVKLQKSLDAESALRAHGFDVETHYFPGNHELRPEEVDRMMEWLERKAAAV